MWESDEASRQALPSRALELIGYPPAVAHGFEVEATTEGRYETEQLALQGLAFAEIADPCARTQKTAPDPSRPPF
ncbi:hypothetical protein [Streptomyces sp. NPDC048825]|uniref:hypothetical protein n=1 Tax=Streptomyces sp. NPDC048825 TaxID=3365592 RepID=UPI0037185B7E